MEAVIKTILGVFICVMIVFSGLAILNANNRLAAAEKYLYAAAGEISAANFADAVSAAKIKEAKEQNYDLSIRLISSGEGTGSSVAYAVITMQYPYEIAMLNLHETRTRQLIVY